MAVLALATSQFIGCNSSEEKSGSEPETPTDVKETPKDQSTSGTDEPAIPRSINVPEGFDYDVFHYSDQGSGFFPISVVRALIDSETGQPYLENLERFGLLPGRKSERNPEGFPVGIVTNEITVGGKKVEMFGFTCAACHTSDIHYKGETVRVEGGSGLFYVDALGDAISKSINATVKDPELAWDFLKRHHKQSGGDGSFITKIKDLADLKKDTELAKSLGEHVIGRLTNLRKAITAEHDANDSYLQMAGDDLKKAAETIAAAAGSSTSTILKDVSPEQVHAALAGLESSMSDIHYRLKFLKVRGWLMKPDNRLDAGYGRADDFGTARVELFAGWNKKNMVPVNAPVSTPPLWNAETYAWLHWNANTNSVIQRSIGESIGVGATFNAKTLVTSVNIVNQMLMEKELRHVQPPEWPSDLLGKPDDAKVKHGSALYAEHCAKCHDPAGLNDNGLVLFNLSTLEEVGTDPNDAVNFDLPVYREDDSTVGFAEAIKTLLDGLQRTAKKSMSAENQALMGRLEENHTPALWRDTMTATGGPVYPAKPLQGVWATAPYLHNGSVPTLYHLLLPADQRPKTFLVGQKDYDPELVGFEIDPEKITDDSIKPFEFDTSQSGNLNTGHEFGTKLSDDDRMALVEYLKVHVDPPAKSAEKK